MNSIFSQPLFLFFILFGGFFFLFVFFPSHVPPRVFPRRTGRRPLGARLCPRVVVVVVVVVVAPLGSRLFLYFWWILAAAESAAAAAAAAAAAEEQDVLVVCAAAVHPGRVRGSECVRGSWHRVRVFFFFQNFSQFYENISNVHSFILFFYSCLLLISYPSTWPVLHGSWFCVGWILCCWHISRPMVISGVRQFGMLLDMLTDGEGNEEADRKVAGARCVGSVRSSRRPWRC